MLVATDEDCPANEMTQEIDGILEKSVKKAFMFRIWQIMTTNHTEAKDKRLHANYHDF